MTCICVFRFQKEVWVQFWYRWQIWSSLSLDIQKVANSSKDTPDQPSSGEREEKAPQSGGDETDDRSVDGDGQEWDRGSEEAKEGNLDWAEQDEHDLVSMRWRESGQRDKQMGGSYVILHVPRHLQTESWVDSMKTWFERTASLEMLAGGN